jgi:hypothetical protein
MNFLLMNFPYNTNLKQLYPYGIARYNAWILPVILFCLDQDLLKKKLHNMVVVTLTI